MRLLTGYRSTEAAGEHRQDKAPEYCQQLPFVPQASGNIVTYMTSRHHAVKRYLQHMLIYSYSRTESCPGDVFITGTGRDHLMVAVIGRTVHE